MTRAQKLEERRRQLGRKATYRKLGERCSVTYSNIFRVLKEQETAFDFDRERIMDEIEAALDEIERQAEEDEANNPRLFSPRSGKRTERQAQRRRRDSPHAGAGLFGSDAA